MVDIHSHILPGIDDGSESWEMTAEMCRVAALDGITHMVATPHCDDQYEYDRERYTAMLGDLFDTAEGRLTFSIGCDFHLSTGNIEDALADPQRYTIGDSRYLLVEFAHNTVPPNAREQLLTLLSRGVVPIVTHPERNRALMKDPSQVLAFAALGCLVQVTANSFTGYWGPQSMKVAEWLLRRRAVHVIASDAHDLKRRRPVLSEARERIAGLVGVDIADALATDNPAAIVAGRSVPYAPALR